MDTAASLRVVIVEDEGLYREMLATCLTGQPTVKVVGAFTNGDQLLAQVDELQPDVAILDFELPGLMHGIALGRALRRERPGVGIVLLSNHAVPHLLSTLPPELLAGWAYLLKKSVANVATLTRAISASAAGIVSLDSSLVAVMRPRSGSHIARLTSPQREVLDLLAQGYSNAGIAAILRLEEKAVALVVQALYADLGIETHNRAFQPRVQLVLTYLNQTRMHRESRPAAG